MFLFFALVACSTTTMDDACTTLGETSCDCLLECNLTFTDRDLCIDQVVGACCDDDGTSRILRQPALRM